jgi:hypothetical protein
MHFATRVRTWRVARLYSEVAVSRKPLGIGHMYIYTILLRTDDTITSQNIDLSSWDILYKLKSLTHIVPGNQIVVSTDRRYFTLTEKALIPHKTDGRV